MSFSIRISRSDRQALRDLSKATGKSMQDLLSAAIDAFQRKWILSASGEAFRELK